MATTHTYATLIVGAGFSGLGAGIKLAQANVDDIVILMSGCNSWYLTKDGFDASMYPGFATQYLRQMRDFQFADYDTVERAAVRVSTSA
jgi:cation diffusion facilitator CzcD-associated flavoprotein CzcO